MDFFNIKTSLDLVFPNEALIRPCNNGGLVHLGGPYLKLVSTLLRWSTLPSDTLAADASLFSQNVTHDIATSMPQGI